MVGAGAWGTALASVLARNGEDVALWAREREVVESINTRRVNDVFLPDIALPRSVRAAADLPAALDEAELVVLAAPSQVLRSVIRGSKGAFGRTAVVVVASKGIERESLAVMTAVAEQELPGRDIVALSGPSFAAEVAQHQPTAIVAASASPESAALSQRTFSSETFRVYTHDDVLGVELGGSLKNVMAVATGIAEGLGLGFNSRAALITRGLAEMTRLGTAMGASPATFAGLAGLGDLVLTCTGTLSRNRAIGMEIGRGATLAQALAGKQTVAEGVDTTRSAHALAQQQGVEMPIVDVVFRILFEGTPARDAIGELMGRELRPEQDR